MRRSVFKVAEEVLAVAYSRERDVRVFGVSSDVTAGELAELVMAFAGKVRGKSPNQARLEAAGLTHGYELLRNDHGAVFVAWRKVGAISGSRCFCNVGAAFCGVQDFPGSGRHPRTRAEWVNRGREIAAGRLLGNPRRLDFDEGEPLREAIWKRLFAPFKCLDGKYLVAERGKFSELWGTREYGSPYEGNFESWMRGFLGEEMIRRQNRKAIHG